MRIVLEDNGTCTMVAGGDTGGARDAIGMRCAYSVTGRTISITEYWEIDDSGPRKKPNRPVVLSYESETDTIVMRAGTLIRLSRTSRPIDAAGR